MIDFKRLEAVMVEFGTLPQASEKAELEWTDIEQAYKTHMLVHYNVRNVQQPFYLGDMHPDVKRHYDAIEVAPSAEVESEAETSVEEVETPVEENGGNASEQTASETGDNQKPVEEPAAEVKEEPKPEPQPTKSGGKRSKS